MSEQHPYRSILSSVPDGVTRPLWSVMIPAYNPGEYLRKTLASVLAQDPGPDVMQITVIDDCYPLNDLAAVVEELGGGRVEYYRQPQNVGIIKNFQTCLELARGKLIHLLHGDDCVRDNFYQKMQQAFSERPEIGAAFCRHIIMDESGHWQDVSVLEQLESGVLPSNWLELIAGFQRIQTPSIVVRREVYEKLGGFDHRLHICGDWEMWVRISAHYPVWYEVEPLALYRKHSKSNTNRTVRNGTYFRELHEAVKIFQEYFPKAIADKYYQIAMQNCAFHTLEMADSILATGDIPIAISLIREALKMSPTFKVIRSAGRIILLDGSLWIWRTVRTALVGRGYKNTEASEAVLHSDV